MKTSLLTVALIASFITTGCASSTVIRSYPAGATVKSSAGTVLGKTPYTYSDSEMNGHSQTFVVEKEGHEEASVTIRRNKLNTGRAAASVVAGLFTFWGFGGLLWANDYETEYQVQLEENRRPVAVLTEDESFEPTAYPNPPLVRAEATPKKKKATKSRAR